ncbi:MAG TPA: c-type cytochrome [Pedobacter sp.]|jgi:Skp family chaperone for outer membrane proteins
MKKIPLLIFALLSIIILATSATQPKAEEPHTGYKNLKVLPKNISRDDLKKVMEHYNAALGVKCNFCHTMNADTKKLDYPSDANEHKTEARSMMKMTNKINIKYFGEKKSQFNPAVMEVSCKTCHQGKKHPEG